MAANMAYLSVFARLYLFTPLTELYQNFTKTQILYLVLDIQVCTKSKKIKKTRWRPIWPIYQFSLYLFTPLTELYQNFTKTQIFYLVLDIQVCSEIQKNKKNKMAANMAYLSVFAISFYSFDRIVPKFHQNSNFLPTS